MTRSVPEPAIRSVRLRSSSAAATRAIGALLGAVACPGDRLWLLGPLGSGKTQLAKGVGVGLGVADEVTSPSFALMAEHEGRLPLFHLDLYRLSGSDEAVVSGMLDEREDAGLTVIEWADRLDPSLDGDHLRVVITPDGDTRRTIEVSAVADGRHARLLDALAAWSADARDTWDDADDA